MVKSRWTDHLANERTFLAWIRTNLGIMAFGFVVERFSLFSKQVAAVLGQPGTTLTTSQTQEYAALFGILLIGIGALLCILAFFQFKKTEKSIDDETYQSPIALVGLLTLFVFFIGIFLILYLIYAPPVTLPK